MSDKPDWLTTFMARLLPLADPTNPDRGTLAELRRCLGDETGRREFYRVGWLFNCVPDYAMDDAALVAALFASHQGHRPGAGLGAAVRKLREDTGSESIEKRFVALLDSEREDLPGRLRHVVSLLKSKEIALDWEQLLSDLRGWDSDKRWVQRGWAHDFWKEVKAERSESEATAPVETATE